MAIYRLSADIVKRSAGRTATAAVAYRAGEVITDARTGLVFDYSRRRGVLHAEIIAPEGAPAWMRDRSLLWNGVEAAEKRKDAQLAREIELALPHELDGMQRRELVRGFVRAAFVSAGMVADVALHAPGEHGDQRNHHAHVMLTMRRIEDEGFGDKERAWNDPALLETWRALWAEHVNQALDLAGGSARVDHRSLEAQGVDRLPGIHLGPAVMEMQRRGVATERAELAQKIAATNAELMTPPDGGAHDVATATYKCALDDFAGAGAALTQRPKASAASELSRQSSRAFTAPQWRRDGVPMLFRRVGRALVLRLLQRLAGTARRPQHVGRIAEARAPP
jgi:hypothetical protein